MNRPMRNLILGVTILGSSAAMAGVTLFEGDNFTGRRVVVDSNTSNFNSLEFNDRAQSAIVEGGSWELCIDRDFGGGCTTLAPGRYPSLAGWTTRISSARMVAAGPTAMAPTPSRASSGITFYANEDFGGREVAADRSLANFGSVNYNDRPQSAIVEGGAWEICADRNFGGGCAVLAPGRYPSLGDWSRRVSSARPLGSRPSVGATAAVGSSATVVAGSRSGITLYANEDFTGREVSADRSLSDLGARSFNDRPQSAIVEGGAWEVCADRNFGGNCTILAPGQYPSLGDWTRRVSSARPMRDARSDGARDNIRGRASAMLFSGVQFSGRQFTLGGEGANTLNGTFNDRASSLRIDRGYWIFCSDANFGGECRTFGPGEYPVLPPELENRISSGRRITNEYPYARQSGSR